MNTSAAHATPGQTVGPFFGYALPFDRCNELVPPGSPSAVQLSGVVLDGDGRPVPDALLEIWQANADGTIPDVRRLATPGRLDLHRVGPRRHRRWRTVQLLHRHPRSLRSRCGTVLSDHRVRPRAAQPAVHTRLRAGRAAGRRSTAGVPAARAPRHAHRHPRGTPDCASTSNCRTRQANPRRSFCATRDTSDDRPLLAGRRPRRRPDEWRRIPRRRWWPWNGRGWTASSTPALRRKRRGPVWRTSSPTLTPSRSPAAPPPTAAPSARWSTLLRERSTAATARWLHRGLTSQDVVDTALVHLRP